MKKRGVAYELLILVILIGTMFSIKKLITSYKVDWSQGDGMVDDILLAHTPIQNQGKTSNCWAYSMTSMMESEMMAKGMDSVSIDPMFFVDRKPHKERHGGIPQLWLKIYDDYGINASEDKPISVDDFIVLTSFGHHKYNKDCVLSIPDNYEDDVFYNIKADQLIESVYNSLTNGHTVVWEGDVHESGFSTKQGLALLSKADVNYSTFRRMLEYLLHLTTDDHMMHIIGYAHSNQGQRFFIAKNSIGQIGKHKGYIYLSEEYVRAKTIAITILKQYVKKR